MGSMQEMEGHGASIGMDDDDDKAVIGPPYDPLVPQLWQDKLRQFSGLNVIKYPRIFQTLLYLIQLEPKEELCVEATNAIEWKKARNAFKEDAKIDIFKMIADYQFEGPKDNEFKLYEKLVFLQNNIDEIRSEDVADYSQGLAQLLLWLRSAIELRITDVCTRRRSKRAAKALREDAIESEEARIEKRNTYVEEKKEDFDKRMEDEKQARIQLAKDAGDDTPPEDDDVEEFDEE